MTTHKFAEDITVFGKRLSENSIVLVQRPEAGEKEQHQGLLIGNLRDQFLVIGGLEGVALGVGEKVILRMVLDNYLIGFESNIVKKIENPTIYVTSFPIKIETINLRKQHRVQAFFPADVQLSRLGADQNDLHVLKTRVLDISAGGCSFRSKSKVPANTEVKISFTLPGDRHIQSIKALVIDSRKVASVFHNRVKFHQEPANLPIVQEIEKWIADSLSFASEDV